MMTLLVILAIVVAGAIAIIALKPDDFEIVRSATVAAPAAAVFPHINDLQKWQAWSPWAKMDPSAKNTFNGPPAGTGAICSWSGSKKVGEGTMTIIDSQPDHSVAIRLDFRKPFSATNRADFTLSPVGQSTIVNWRMTGKRAFMMKAVTSVIDCDKMVGAQFEDGLAAMKEIAEKR